MNENFLAELTLPGRRPSVSVARHCVGRIQTVAGHRNVDGVQLVVTELVGNAVLHTVSGLAGGLVTVVVSEIGDATAHVSVIDQGSSRSPEIRDPGDLSCSGRGLQIVEQAAVRWGVHDDALGGRKVWAEVLTTEEGPVAAMDVCEEGVMPSSMHDITAPL
ncbi:ATP-binding protein [Nonomuraea glycinis]|uniref:ATP-binding protein n=1 Tax=Nonomuraea glycinis TaxID=2047744 RepID=UPI002E159754|nr:ATP-binding protein [Nonomuraea glycinis]